MNTLSLTRPRSSWPPPPQNAIKALAAWGLYDLVTRARAVQQLPPPPQWITIREASAYSGLSMVLLGKLIAAKKLPALKDGSIKVRRSDLAKLNNLAEMAECGRKLAGLGAELRKVRGR